MIFNKFFVNTVSKRNMAQNNVFETKFIETNLPVLNAIKSKITQMNLVGSLFFIYLTLKIENLKISKTSQQKNIPTKVLK